MRSGAGGPQRKLAKPPANPGTRRRRARSDLERDSALPAGLFECQEPMLELALIDAAASVFLAKLGQPTATPDVDAAAAAPPPATEVVDDATLAACLLEFRNLADEPPPDLLCGLDDERLWVLLDLARNGTGLSRQRATVELRRLLRELSGRPADKHALLQNLARQLDGAAAGTFPVVFRALLLEVQSALRRIDQDAGQDSSRPAPAADVAGDRARDREPSNSETRR